MLTREQLHGWSYDKASLMGLPNIGAKYVTARRYKLTTDTCAVCGARATNVHHIVPKRNGYTFALHNHELRSPLIALCGSGTTGCHGLFHSGKLKAVWEWNSEEYERQWWSGELIDRHGAHSQAFFKYGNWTIERMSDGQKGV